MCIINHRIILIDHPFFFHLTGLDFGLATSIARTINLKIPSRQLSEYELSEIIFYQVYGLLLRVYGLNKVRSILSAYRLIKDDLVSRNYLIVDLVKKTTSFYDEPTPLTDFSGKKIGDFISSCIFHEINLPYGEVRQIDKMLVNLDLLRNLIIENAQFLLDKNNRDRICFVHKKNFYLYELEGIISVAIVALCDKFERSFNLSLALQKLGIQTPGKFYLDENGDWHQLPMAVQDLHKLPNGKDYAKANNTYFPSYKIIKE